MSDSYSVIKGVCGLCYIPSEFEFFLLQKGPLCGILAVLGSDICIFSQNCND